MKNREYLFNLDDYDLAEYLVTFVRQDIDGNDVYADPSGIEWFIFEEAHKKLEFDSNKTALWELNQRLLNSDLK